MYQSAQRYKINKTTAKIPLFPPKHSKNGKLFTIGDVLRDFKKFTSKSIVKAIQENEQESRKEWLMNRFRFRAANNKKVTNYKFWQDDNHVETIYSYEFFKQKLDYLHQNPVKQEFVEKAEDYLYSSARNYAGMDGLLNVIVAQ